MERNLIAREMNQLCVSINVFLVAAFVVLGIYICQFLLLAFLTANLFHSTIQADEERFSTGQADEQLSLRIGQLLHTNNSIRTWQLL